MNDPHDTAPQSARGVTEPKQPDKSLGELVGDMTTEISTLFRQEIELAKVEAQEQAARAGRAAGMFAGAAVGALLALLLLSFALAWWLDQEMNQAVAFLIVGAIWLVVAAAAGAAARSALRSVRAMPATTQTIKEDIEWARAQKA